MNGLRLRAALVVAPNTHRDLLVLLAHAATLPEIARRLGLSLRTVRNYTSDLTRRLGVSTVADAIVYAYATKMVRPEGSTHD